MRDVIALFGCQYRRQVAGVEDLEELYRYYTARFGTDLVEIELMAQWIGRNEQIAWRVLKSKGGLAPEHCSGFFDLEPLNRSGEEKLCRVGAKASDLSPDDLVKGGSPIAASAYYIGSIGTPVGSSKIDEGVCVAHMLAVLGGLTDGHGITLYARPTTDSGLRIVRDVVGMDRLHPGGDKEVIWSKVIGSEEVALFRRHRRFAARVER